MSKEPQLYKFKDIENRLHTLQQHLDDLTIRNVVDS